MKKLYSFGLPPTQDASHKDRLIGIPIILVVTGILGGGSSKVFQVFCYDSQCPTRNAFHGRTMGALALTWKETRFRDLFELFGAVL